MDLSNLYSGSYFKAAQFAQPTTLVIDGLEQVAFDDGDKLAISFQGQQQQLLLNKTNFNMLVDAFGYESGGWIGKNVQLKREKTLYQGKMVDCIRVYPSEIHQDPPEPPQLPQTVGNAPALF